jgi:hypothetical protein
MKYLFAKIIKWKRGKSTHRYTRNDEFSAKLCDAIYENNFELAKLSSMAVRWMSIQRTTVEILHS